MIRRFQSLALVVALGFSFAIAPIPVEQTSGAKTSDSLTVTVKDSKWVFVVKNTWSFEVCTDYKMNGVIQQKVKGKWVTLKNVKKSGKSLTDLACEPDMPRSTNWKFTETKLGTKKYRFKEKGSTWYQTFTVVVKADQCPINGQSFATIASEYGLSKSEVASVSSACNGKSTAQALRGAIADVAVSKYPGLAGNVTASVSSEQYLSYYVSAIEFGLEIIPGNLDKWNDPLIQSFLISGFPATKGAIGTAIRSDSRFDYTERAKAEARALAYAFACGLGSQAGCDSRASAQAAVTALGPLVK